MKIVEIKILTGDAWYINKIGSKFLVDLDNSYTIYKKTEINDNYYVSVINNNEYRHNGIKLGHTNYKQATRKEKITKLNEKEGS